MPHKSDLTEARQSHQRAGDTEEDGMKRPQAWFSWTPAGAAAFIPRPLGMIEMPLDERRSGPREGAEPTHGPENQSSCAATDYPQSHKSVHVTRGDIPTFHHIPKRKPSFYFSQLSDEDRSFSECSSSWYASVTSSQRDEALDLIIDNLRAKWHQSALQTLLSSLSSQESVPHHRWQKTRPPHQPANTLDGVRGELWTPPEVRWERIKLLDLRGEAV